MFNRRIITISLLFALAVSGTVVAAPAPKYKERRTTDAETQKAPLEQKRVEGKVESITGQKAIIRTPEGERTEVLLGPQDFWRERGYRLKEGDEVTVQGWGDSRERGGFYAGEVWGPGFHFRLTHDDGYPLWAERDYYWDGWYPSWYYMSWYWEPRYRFGPPPWWTAGPPPPPPWWYDRYYHRHHHRHYPRHWHRR